MGSHREGHKSTRKSDRGTNRETNRETNKKEKENQLIPVVSFSALDQVEPYLTQLVTAGLNTIEIVLRHETAMDAIKQAISIKSQQLQSGIEAWSDFTVGVGTVINVPQLEQVHELGVDYVLSPGISSPLLKKAEALNLPLIPGVATASEIMLGLEHGYDRFKCFPANVLGGVAAIKALSAPFPGIQFCPTGGITLENMRDYLALPSVFAVGGSWIAPPALLAAHRWEEVSELLTRAVARIHELDTTGEA